MDAERRDAEMAKQLTEIKEQALERIRESTAAAREVATLKERCHASELERDRLRDKVQELEHDERTTASCGAWRATPSTPPRRHARRADRCELAEARLRQEQAHVASLPGRARAGAREDAGDDRAPFERDQREGRAGAAQRGRCTWRLSWRTPRRSSLR